MRKMKMPRCKCGKTYGHHKLGDKCKRCKTEVDIRVSKNDKEL